MGDIFDDLTGMNDGSGVKITIDSDGVHKEVYEPLTEDDIDDFGDMDLEILDRESLEDLLEKVEELRDELDDRLPEDEDDEEYELLEDRICEAEDFIDRIRDRIEELEEE